MHNRELPTNGLGRVFGALRHRDYRLLWVGTLLTQMGQWTHQIGQGWLVFELTGSPFQLGLVAMCMGAAMFIFAPIGGALTDRMSRTYLMLLSQAIIMVGAVILASLVISEAIRIWHVYIFAAFTGGSFAMNGPARNSLVFDIVGERLLSNAIALQSMAMNTMRVVGPSLAGLMLGTVGVSGTFTIQATAYIFAMATSWMIKTSAHRPKEPQEPFFSSLIDGLRYLKKDRTMSLLLVATAISAFFGMAYMQLMPGFAGKTLGLDGAGFGYLMITQGVGGIVGSLAMAATDSPNKGRALVLSIFALGTLQVSLGGIATLPVSIISLIGLGFAGAFNLALGNTLVQTYVLDEYRGRVMAIYFMTFSLQPIGVLLGGTIAEVIGLANAIVVLGSIVALLITIMGVFSRVRNL